jgi:Uma2 family endonuclease
MPVLESSIPLEDQQHIVLEDVSWELYEHLIKEIGDRNIRVTFDEGRLEIMSPQFTHELFGEWTSRLIEMICFEQSIPVASAGSTTFALRKRKKGLEPDKCYYFKHAEAASKFKGKFNPKIHPAPELAVEIDITSRSVPREPIYAALGVPELWRFDGARLQVLHLLNGKYAARTRSLTLPFLPMTEFEAFILRMSEANQLLVLREFRAWINALPKRR